MVKNARFPALNPLRFTLYGETLPDSYNVWPFDSGAFATIARRWETQSTYHQKFNFDDRILVYFDALCPTVKVHCYDEQGNELAGGYTIGPAYALPSNTVNIGGVDYPYRTFWFSFRLSYFYAGTNQKIFYVGVEHVYDIGDPTQSVWYVSEPVFGRTKWLDTMLITYTQTANEYDVLFEQTAPVFQLRVEAGLEPTDMISHSTSFEDQQYQVRNLQDIPIRMYNFIVGGEGGVPDYVRDKANRAFSCKNFKLDSVRFVKDANAKWQLTKVPNTLLKSQAIAVREYETAGGLSGSGSGLFVDILQLPYDSGIIYPFVNNFIAIDDGFTTAIYHADYPAAYASTATKIADHTALLAWLAVLNGTFAATIGLLGTFSVSGTGMLQYSLGTGETWGPSASYYMRVWFKKMSLAISINTIVTPYSFVGIGEYVGPGAIGIAIVDWGDTAVKEVTFLPGGSTATHAYALGTYTLDIYHGGADTLAHLAGLSFTPMAAGGGITDINSGSELPVFCREFLMRGQPMVGVSVYDGFLVPCQSNLQLLSIIDCSISSFANDLLGLTTLCPVLKYISLRLNKFNTANVNSLIIVAFGAGFKVNAILGGPGTYLINNQTPLAPPSGTAATYVPILISFGWTVLTD